MASPRGEPGRPANRGTARRFDRLVALENLRPASATLNVCVFRCAPRPPPLKIEIALLEKHPASTQVFLPMSARRYLVVVALGDARPDLSTLAAFEAAGGQGISYHPGVWHHPMIALDAQADFACLVWEDGSDTDCIEVSYEPDERPWIELDPSPTDSR
jgi:ureidoglycolate lyase